MKAVRAIFFEVMDITPSQRGPYLDDACRGDADLRAQVEDLLSQLENAGDFLGTPFVDFSGTPNLLREPGRVPPEDTPPRDDSSQERPDLVDTNRNLAPGQFTPKPGSHWEPKLSCDRFAPPPQVPGFEVFEEVGRGGMGVVFHARQLKLNRVVALKLALRGTPWEELQRFRAEAEAMAALDHPNVVKIFEVGTHEGLPYVTLEYCAAGSLEAWCGQGPHSSRRVAEVIEQVARGAAAAHAQGLVHRDLKPANILLSDQGVAKVTDFGLAKKPHEAGVTAPGMVLGTPSYMAPEQAEVGKRVGPAADVWALGVILYQLLTGKLPFEGSDALSVLRQVLDREPLSPRSIDRRIPCDLEAICLKCLSKEFHNRYLSAEGLADDLRRWLDGVPIEARPAGRVDRAWKWLKRNPAAGAAVAALVLGVATSTGFAIRAELAREAEAQQRELVQETAKRETAERLLKEQALADAEAYSVFLNEDFLGAARPKGINGGLGVQISVGEALAAAEQKIPLRFEGQPVAEAKARHGVGVTWVNLAKYPAALRNLTRAVDLRTRHLGWTHQDTLSSRMYLAIAVHEAGNYGESAEILRQILPQAEETLGNSNTLTMDIRSNLASVDLSLGQIEEAIQGFRQVAERRLAVSGPTHRETLAAYTGLAQSYSAAGRFDDALELLQRSEQHVRSPDHRYILSTLYLDAGRLEEAISICEELLEEREEEFGPRHHTTLVARSAVVSVYTEIGRLPEALKLSETTLKDAESVLGEHHPQTLVLRSNLAGLYQTVGRLQEAISLLEQSRRFQDSRLGQDHPFTLATCASLALAYKEAGRVKDGIDLMRWTLNQYVAKLGDEHPDTLVCRHDLATIYRAAGRAQEGLDLLELTLQQRERVLGPDHPATCGTRNNLAVAYHETGRVQEGRRLQQTTVEQLEAKLGKAHPDTLIAFLSFAASRQRSGQSAEAVGLFRQAVQRAEEGLPPTHPVVTQCREALATACWRAKKLDQSVPLFEQILQDRRRTFGDDHLRTLQTRHNLAVNYLEVGQAAKAISLLRQLRERTARLEEDHPFTLRTLSSLSTAYWRVGRLEDSIPGFEELLQRTERKYGPAHPDTLTAKVNLGINYRDAGQLDEGIPLLEEVLARAAETPDDLEPLLAWVSKGLAVAYDRAGRREESERLYRERLERARQRFGANSQRTGDAAFDLALNLFRQRKAAAAEEAFRECLRSLQKSNPDFSKWIKYSSGLGEVLITQKKFFEAESHTLREYEQLKGVFAADHLPAGLQSERSRRRVMWTTLDRLARLYIAMGRPEEAGRWRAEANQLSTNG